MTHLILTLHGIEKFLPRKEFLSKCQSSPHSPQPLCLNRQFSLLRHSCELSCSVTSSPLINNFLRPVCYKETLPCKLCVCVCDRGSTCECNSVCICMSMCLHLYEYVCECVCASLFSASRPTRVILMLQRRNIKFLITLHVNQGHQTLRQNGLNTLSSLFKPRGLSSTLFTFERFELLKEYLSILPSPCRYQETTDKLIFACLFLVLLLN